MPLLRPPFTLWPLRLQVLLACGVVLAAALAGWGVERTLTARKLQLQQDVAQQLPTSPVRTESPDGAEFVNSLATRNASEDVARNVARFAQDLGVQVTALSVEQRKATDTELGKVQFNITASADYVSAKAWLNELLGRYRALAVQSLSLQANPTDTQHQDLRLILVLYVKD